MNTESYNVLDNMRLMLRLKELISKAQKEKDSKLVELARAARVAMENNKLREINNECAIK